VEYVLARVQMQCDAEAALAWIQGRHVVRDQTKKIISYTCMNEGD
jgi:hypothetical protein